MNNMNNMNNMRTMMMVSTCQIAKTMWKSNNHYHCHKQQLIRKAFMTTINHMQHRTTIRPTACSIAKSLFSSKTSSNLPRFEHLRQPTQNDVQAFLQMMNNRQSSIITDPEKLKEYNTDWTKHYQGHSSILCRPKNSKEVASILKYCNEHKIGVVPQGGNTGVVGSATPMGDQEVIISLQNLDQIESFDQSNGILICGSGCILQKLQDSLATWNHLVPIDLGSKGTCMIGGNISTNAGGSYYFRFGSIHSNIIGLEVVLANGTILDLMNINRKDNTGYDLKHLFVGAEGTLGIITKVAMSCPRLPTARNAAFLACESYDAVQKTLSLAKQELGEILGAFELMDQEVLDIVANEIKIPIQKDSDGRSTTSEESSSSNNYRFCLLVETLGSNDEHDKEKINSFLGKAMENNHIVDGVVAQDLKQVSVSVCIIYLITEILHGRMVNQFTYSMSHCFFHTSSCPGI